MVAFTGIVVALLVLAPSAAIGTVGARRSSGEKIACFKLKTRYPDNTFLPGTPGYAYETQDRKLSKVKRWACANSL